MIKKLSLKKQKFGEVMKAILISFLLVFCSLTVSQEPLTLEELPQAIDKYNNRRGKQITSLQTYRVHAHYIEGALPAKTYQVLHNMDKEGFTRFIFSRIKHLTPQELPEAIRRYPTVHDVQITSLPSYKKYYDRIQWALSFNTYQILYNITPEGFEKLMQSATMSKVLTAEEIKEYEKQQKQEQPETRTQPNETSNENTPTLTWEQTAKAVVEHNEPEALKRNGHAFPIDSWSSYTQYHHQIPGADTIQNLEKQYQEEKGTQYGFMESLLGQTRRDLTPIELSKAIAKYNDEVSTVEQIDYLEDYEIFYYRIPHAPTLEAFRKSVTANWNQLFQEKFETIENYIEFIILKNPCQVSFGK